ncbi:fructose-1,6-bisphosphatase [Bacillus velezensis]|nr:fructose-1,6-bisphosphatase [Bacillus velezensis]
MIVIVGYTLLNSYGMQLVTDKHFKSKAEVLSTGTDVLTVKRLIDKEPERKKVKETNVGEELLQEVANFREFAGVSVYGVRDI